MSTSTRPSASEADAEIGKRLYYIRKISGLSQGQLGKRAGISYQQIQKYEAGQNRISAVRLQQFADILGVPLAYFFGDNKAQFEGVFEESNDNSNSIREFWKRLPDGNIRIGLYILLHALTRTTQEEIQE